MSHLTCNNKYEEQININHDFTYVDSMALARVLVEGRARFGLDSLVKHYKMEIFFPFFFISPDPSYSITITVYSNTKSGFVNHSEDFSLNKIFNFSSSLV